MGRTAKLTITLPKELISLADRVAKEQKISRSKVVSACLQELAEKQKTAEMAEGYKVMAGKHKQFADAAFKLVREVIPEWK